MTGIDPSPISFEEPDVRSRDDPCDPVVSPCAKSALMGGELVSRPTNELLRKRFHCGELMRHEGIEYIALNNARS